MLYGKKAVGTIAVMSGIPSIPEPFMWSLTQMIEYNGDYLCESNERIHYIKSCLSFHAAARNNLVDQMFGDWLLMLDTDHQFEPDLAARMVFCMNKYKVNVLTGLYTHKTDPYVPVIYTYEKKGFSPLVVLDRNVSIFEVDSAGGGCLMVKREVFTRIRTELKESPFDIIPPYGEDHSFFLRLRKLGIKSYCNPSIESNHLSWRASKMDDLNKSELQLVERNDIKGFK